MHKKWYSLQTLLATAAIAFIVGLYVPTSLPKSPTVTEPNQTKADPAETDIEVKDLREVWEALKKNYYDFGEVKIDELETNAVRGFVEGLHDPYSVYMGAQESKEFESDLDGKLEGIGAELEQREGMIRVVNLLKKSPAEKAGVHPRDIILKIDGADASKMKFIDAVRKIRGAKGSVVTLTVIREDEENPLEIGITRDTITVASIEAKKLPGKITQLIVNNFNNNTISDFNQILQEMLLDKPNGIIIDLRNNGGGYLDTAVEFLSFILPPDKLAVTVKKRDPQEDRALKTSGDGPLSDVPVVVLINKFSASASEIVAGAVQDYKRGPLIGEKSYGKGSVQELMHLSDGSLLRLTIAKWFTPNGRTIDKVGLDPDLVVEYTKEDKAAGKDPQLDAALKRLQTK